MPIWIDSRRLPAIGGPLNGKINWLDSTTGATLGLKLLLFEPIETKAQISGYQDLPAPASFKEDDDDG
jgi:hypothetical protein